MTGIYRKALKKGVTVALLTLLLSSATQPLLAQGNQDRSLSSKVIYTDELEKLGVSTIQEALNLVKSISSKQQNTKRAKSEVLYKGVELTGDKQVELNETLSGLSLEDLDKIEISPDGDKVKYHLSKSLTKDGIKALFSFTVVDLSDIPSKLDPEVITATKTPVKVSELGDVIRVIHADELSLMGVSSIEEALALLSNVRFKDSGGIVSFSSRGLKNGNTTVLFDGVNVKDAMDIDGAANFRYLPVSDLERIEIVAGSKGVYHGSGAVGSVINIVTKAGSEGGYLSTRVAANQQYTTFKTGVDHELGSFYVVGNTLKNNSISLRVNTDERDLFANQSITVGLRNSSLFNGTLNGFFTFSDSHQEIDDHSADDVDAFTKVNQQVAKLTYSTAFSDNSQTDLGVSYTDLSRHYRDERGANDTDAQYKGRIYNVNFQHNMALSLSQHFSIGSLYSKERASASGFYFGDIGFPVKTQEEVALYSQYRWLNPILSAQLGSKLSYYSQEDKKDDVALYNVSLFRNLPILDAELKATWKTGYKLPSIYQRFNPKAGSVGDPNLKPEESETRELSLAKQFKNLRFSSTYFETDIDNIIVQHCTDGQDFNFNSGCKDDLGFYKNVNQAETKGFDHALDIFSAGPFEFLRFGYTNIESIDNTDTPEYQFTTMTGIRNGKWRYGALLRFIGETESGINAYNYADITLQYAYNKSIKLYSKVHNVADNQYQVANGYNSPGRTVFFGLKKTF